MNKACAAGTGSFLQEQAEKLKINIEQEFGDRALSAECPVGCGERCTVFMESDLVSHQRRGAKTDDIVAGLAYSIVSNYLTKVVGDRKIGDPAKRQSVMNPEKTIYSIKRFMGSSYDESKSEIGKMSYKISKGDNNSPRVNISDRRYSPQEISAMVLQKMKKTAEEYLKV